MDRKIVIAAVSYKKGAMSLVSFYRQVKLSLIKQKRDIDNRSVKTEAIRALKLLTGRI